MFNLDLGTSIHFKASVSEVIFSHAQWTFLLVGVSIVLSVSIGMFLGVISAWFYGSRGDSVLYSVLISVGAIPTFVLGTILLLVFSVQWNWFPLSGNATAFAEYSKGIMGLFENAGDILYHATLPVLTLTLVNIPSIYLLIRGSMLTVIKDPYIFTAEAKGLTTMRLLFHHTLRNALLPVMTSISLRIAFLFTGAILVETVYSYPGMGNLMYTAITTRDYPLMQGLFLVFTTTIVMINLLTDLLYPMLDPRIRRKETKDYA